MVVSTGPQLNGTWLNWKSFHYPSDSGPRWAYSVPTDVANQINSGYSLMIDMMIGQFWILTISFVIAVILRKTKASSPVFKELMPDIWNGKDDFRAVVVDKIPSLYSSKDMKYNVLLSLALVFLFALYCGQKAMSILVSPKVILDTAAPVNPDAIYVPNPSKVSNSLLAARYVLSTPWALRALGTATASMATLSKRVTVSDEIPLGTFNGTNQAVSQVTYGYEVTGADMGLQKYPQLTLTVNGSCFTEYNWYMGPAVLLDYECIGADAYQFFDNSSDAIYLSALNGPAPMAFFQQGSPNLAGTLPTSNKTWGAVISSMGKPSFTAGTDAWYLTEVANTSESNTNAGYVVARGRPALSCWEDNVWSYKGQTAVITNLSSLSGLDLSEGMQSVLTQYLSVPMVFNLGMFLGSSALVSGNAALGSIIDAGAYSFAQDLHRLIVASYVATTNVLTTTTLYPVDASTKLDNYVKSTSGQIEAGVADFVVWTSDATALDMVVVITIPIVLITLFLLNFFLLRFTSMAKAEAISAPELFSKLIETHKNAKINFDWKKGASWDLSVQESNEGVSQNQDTKTEPMQA